MQKNLAGQTPIRVAPAWATQNKVLAGFAQVVQPDRVVREDQLQVGLRQLAEEVGRDMPMPPERRENTPHSLASIHDSEIEAAVRAVYQRDYMQFGFWPWVPDGPV